LEDRFGDDRFERSRERFEVIVDWLGGEESGGVEHCDLETRLASDGRELLRVLFQDHLDLWNALGLTETGLVGLVSNFILLV
jgi:hypothetical protein